MANAEDAKDRWTRRDGPLVSIIVPVYNAAGYLEACLESILGQTYEKIEVICINDGSVDQSLEELTKWQKTDGRVHVISQSNHGVAEARNRGLSLAVGDYVVFVDADDIVGSRAIERYVDEIANDCEFAMEVSRPILVAESHTTSNIPELIAWGLRHETLNSPTGRIYRRDILATNDIRFPQGISIGEDLVFNIQYVSKCESVRVFPGSNYYARQTPGSLTRSYRPDKYRELAAVRDAIGGHLQETYPNSQFTAEIRYLHVKNLVSCAIDLYSNDSPLSRTQARGRVKTWQRENPIYPIPTMDLKTKALVLAYNRVGLGALAQTVGMLKRFHEHRWPHRRSQ